MTLKTPPGKKFENGVDVLLDLPIPKKGLLQKGIDRNGVLYFQHESVEENTQLLIHTWQIAHPATPIKIYLAIFTWTILASTIDSPKSIEEIEMLNKMMYSMQFSPMLGKTE